MSRDQRGWLRVEGRRAGETWVLRYNVTRASDGKRVEHTKTIGLLSQYPTESTAWAEVERQNLNVNNPDFKARVSFADLCRHYLQHEVLNPARKQQKLDVRDAGNQHLTLNRLGMQIIRSFR